MFVWFSDLKHVQRENFKNMQHLIRLDLAYNKVADLPEDVFWDLSNLEGLWLQDNQITSLNKNLFKNLPKLKFIAAERNEIEQLDRDLFRNNVNLEKVYLGNNKIKSIEVKFESFSFINAVDFTMNICIDKEFNDEPNWCTDVKSD